jgi:hypothetical protein
MKNNMIKYLACAAMALGLAATVQAAQINGSLGFSGQFTQNGGTSGDLSSATTLSIGPWAVGAAIGDFAGTTVPNVLSLISDFNVFHPITTLNGPLSPAGQTMWTVKAGNGNIYSFDVTSEMQTWNASQRTLIMSGTGTFSDTVGDTAAGDWQLSFGVTGAAFTFQDTAATGVPDGGMTVMLLGAALSGLALIRRKLA